MLILRQKMVAKPDKRDELGAALYALADLIETDSLVDWNDHQGQTQAKVVAVLDQAAAAYEDNCALLELSLN